MIGRYIGVNGIMNKTLQRIFLLAVLSSIYFVPLITIVRPEDLIIVSVLSLCVLYSYSHSLNVQLPYLTIYLFFYILIIILGMIHQSAILNTQVVLYSVTEVLHPLRIIIICIFIVKFTQEKKMKYYVIHLVVLLSLAMSISSLVISAVTIYYGPDHLPFIRRYAGVHVRTLINQSRIFGVAVNPNRLAILLVPGVVMSGLILAHKMMGRVYGRKTLIASTLSFGFGFVTLILTQSRTGLIALGGSISISLILLSYSERIDITKSIIRIFLAICLVVLLVSLGILPSRYKILLQTQDLSTLAIRFEIWGELFKNYNSTWSSAIIGHGPNTIYFNEFGGTDGEWASIAFKYGLLGIIAVILFYMSVIRHSVKSLYSKDIINKLLGSVSIGLVIAAILYGITDQILLNQRIIALFVCIWAVQIEANPLEIDKS